MSIFHRLGRHGIALAVGIGAVIGGLAATGVSWATIPDSGGVIHGCYKTAGTAHNLKVIDSASTASCPHGYTALDWNQSSPNFGKATNGASVGTTAGATCTLGQVDLFAGNTIPTSDVVANGQLVSISSAPALYSLFSTTYGGDGVSTFALPNLQSQAPNGTTYAVCASGVYP